MKKVVFICSHLYSGSNALYEAMNNHSRIQGYSGLNRYLSCLQLLTLCEFNHKTKNRSAIYMDEIIYNHQISSKEIYKYCKFIYIIRRPEIPINFMISNDKIKSNFALSYYKLRMRRICEMAKRTPGSVLLTYDDLSEGRGLDLISDYLELPQPIEFSPSSLNSLNRNFGTDLLAKGLRSEVEDSYERYLYFLRNLSLRQPQ